MSESIFVKLRDICAESFGTPEDSFKLSARWKEDLSLDSFDLNDLTVSIQSEWDIDLENHAFATVEDTMLVIEAKTGVKN